MGRVSSQSSVEWVERPTGGGIALHGTDVSVALVIPRALGMRLHRLLTAVCESAVTLCRTYGAMATAVLDGPPSVLEDAAPRRLTICLAESSPYAVCLGAQRMAGFAVRRYPQSWLIQGSLLVEPLPHTLVQAMPVEVRQLVHARAIPLAVAAPEPVRARAVAERWAVQWGSWWSHDPTPTLQQERSRVAVGTG